MKYSDAMAQTFLTRFPDPDSFPYRSWCYSQGFMLWGFIRLYEKTGREEYKNYVLSYCGNHADASGRIFGFTGCSLDDIMAGSVLAWAYGETEEEGYRIACKNILASLADYPRNPDGGFWHARDLPGELWLDGIFMGGMFLLNHARYVGDANVCFSELVRQLCAGHARCEKDSSGLLYHAYCHGSAVRWAHPVTGKSSEVWSEGLGWYAMILADTLCALPEEQQGRGELLTHLQKLMEALKLVQHEGSGLWYQVTDKPYGQRNWLDSSGSAMFVYAIERAVAAGLIAPSFHETAIRGFDGLKGRCIIGRDGLLSVQEACDGLCVQNTYNDYVDFPRVVNAKEAMAALFSAAVVMEYGV